MLKKLLSHTMIYGLAPFIPKLAGFIALPIITKDLNEIDFGIFGTITAYVSFFSCLSILGLRVVFMNSFYHNNGYYKWHWRQLYGFLILWMILFSLILSIVIFFSCPAEAKEYIFPIIVANILPIVFFGPTAEIGQLFYQLNQKPIPIAIRSVVFGILTVVLNIFFISYLKLHYMGWFYSICIVTILSNISYWYVVNIEQKITPIFKFKVRTIKRSLSVGLPTIPHFYSSYLVNGFERVIMDRYSVPIGDIGKYNMANTFAGYASQFSNALGFALSPILMSLYKENKYAEVKRLLFLLEAIFISGTFVISLWMKEIFDLLISNDILKTTYPLAIIMIMALNYKPIYYGAVSFLIFKEKTNSIWKITLMGGLVALILNIVLIPTVGYKSVVISTFIAYLIWGNVGFFMKDFKDFCPEKFKSILWSLLYCSLTIVAIFSVNLFIIYKVLITICALLLMLCLFLKFKKNIG